MLRKVVVVFVALAAVVLGFASRPADAARHGVSSLSAGAVTIYGAKWCSACKSLEHALGDRKIAFDLVDVDDNPAAFARARASAGAGTSIPLTSVIRSTNTVWIVGANADAVERAAKSD